MVRITPQEAAQKRGGSLVKWVSPGRSQWSCSEGHIFWMSFNRVKRGRWCRECGSSIGERTIRTLFRQYNIPFTPQAVSPLLPSRKYDFYFEWEGKRFILEFDGEQHFRYVRKYHKNKAGFYQSQLIDRIKTYIAIVSGCHVIRIDYTQRDNIQQHLNKAVGLGSQIYLSTPELYSFLQIPITPGELNEYVPALFSSK